jgi:hypothetical protein
MSSRIFRSSLRSFAEIQGHACACRRPLIPLAELADEALPSVMQGGGARELGQSPKHYLSGGGRAAEGISPNLGSFCAITMIGIPLTESLGPSLPSRGQCWPHRRCAACRRGPRPDPLLKVLLDAGHLSERCVLGRALVRNVGDGLTSLAGDDELGPARCCRNKEARRGQSCRNEMKGHCQSIHGYSHSCLRYGGARSRR